MGAFNALTHLIQSYYPRDENDLPQVPTPLMYQISGRPAPQPQTLHSSLILLERYHQSFQLLCKVRPFFDIQDAAITAEKVQSTTDAAINAALQQQQYAIDAAAKANADYQAYLEVVKALEEVYRIVHELGFNESQIN
jgi:hypothetical protein